MSAYEELILEDAHEAETVSECGAQLALTLYEEVTEKLEVIEYDADKDDDAQLELTVSVCGAHEELIAYEALILDDAQLDDIVSELGA